MKAWDGVAYDALPLPHEQWGIRTIEALSLQPNRGAITTPAGLPLDSAVVFESAQGRIACVRFNQLGRTQLCSPPGANHLSGVNECAC